MKADERAGAQASCKLQLQLRPARRARLRRAGNEGSLRAARELARRRSAAAPLDRPSYGRGPAACCAANSYPCRSSAGASCARSTKAGAGPRRRSHIGVDGSNAGLPGRFRGARAHWSRPGGFTTARADREPGLPLRSATSGRRGRLIWLYALGPWARSCAGLRRGVARASGSAHGTRRYVTYVRHLADGTSKSVRDDVERVARRAAETIVVLQQITLLRTVWT